MDIFKPAAMPFAGKPLNGAQVVQSAFSAVRFSGKTGEGDDAFLYSPLRLMRMAREEGESLLGDLHGELCAEHSSGKRIADLTTHLEQVAHKFYDQPDFRDRELKHEASKQQILAALIENVVEDLRNGTPGTQVAWNIKEAIGPASPPETEPAPTKEDTDKEREIMIKNEQAGSASQPPEGRTQDDVTFWRMIGESYGLDQVSYDPNLSELEALLGTRDSRKIPLIAGMRELEDVADRVAMALLSGEGMSDEQRRELGNRLILGGALIEDHMLLEDPALYEWESRKGDLGWFMQSCGRELANPDHDLNLLNTRLSHWIPQRKHQWNIKTYEEGM